MGLEDWQLDWNHLLLLHDHAMVDDHLNKVGAPIRLISVPKYCNCGNLAKNDHRPKLIEPVL